MEWMYFQLSVLKPGYTKCRLASYFMYRIRGLVVGSLIEKESDMLILATMMPEIKKDGYLE